MGNTSSTICQHLYILKVTNMDLPLCPFIHTISRFNGTPVLNTDPRIFREILTKEDLTFEIIDTRDSSTFTVTIPKGTPKLGINVIKLGDGTKPLNIRVINAREDSPFMIGDQILGIENSYFPDENQLIAHIKSKVRETVTFILLRDNQCIRKDVEIKEELGCEIKTGILYRPYGVECFMEEYNGCIPRMSNKWSGESQAERNGSIKEEMEKTEEAPSLIKEETTPEINVDIGVPTNLSNHLPSEAELGQNHSEDNNNDMKPINILCDETKVPHESEYVRGEDTTDTEGAVLIDDVLVDRNDFILDNSHLKMTNDAFDRYMEGHSSYEPRTCKDDGEEIEGISLDNAGIEQESEHRSIFDCNSEDDDFPFEKESTRPQKSEEITNFGNDPSISTLNTSSLDTPLAISVPFSEVSSSIQAGSTTDYDEWDRISHTVSEPAPLEGRILPTSQVDDNIPYDTLTNITVHPILFDDVPSIIYSGEDTRAASTPSLNEKDSKRHPLDHSDPNSDTEMLL
ncbi:hypothetical protein PAEPH01_0309 [Pancytospora epiphaga]|nr:hypothetical protein PAEPH01_0309 [Pancytospora epiphaga]